MIKLIHSGSYDFDMPSARLIDVCSRGIDRDWMTKRAAVMTREIAELRPESGSSLIHLISMGAQEFWGCNRNADGFNEKTAMFELAEPKPGVAKLVKLAGGLMQYHPTFTKYGHVFKHHKNNDTKYSIGEIKLAAYNPEMHRGELIIKVANNHPDWQDELERLARGKDIPFSMACKVANDMCSYCGNRARTRAEYCDHAKNHISEIVKTGHQIFTINDAPTFFDISKVIRPADRIAWSLQKVASAGMPVVGGAELAEQLSVSAPAMLLEDGPAGSVRKLAAARKLAAIEKTIEGLAQGRDNSHLADQLATACPTHDLEEQDMSRLQAAKLGEALQALGEAKICLSVRDFMRLVMGSNFDSVSGHIPSVEKMLPGVFSRLLNSGELENCLTDGSYEPADGAIPRHLRDLVGKLAGSHSLAAGPSTRRMTITVISGHKPHLHAPIQKSAAVSLDAQKLAREYATYQLAFAKFAEDDAVSTRLLVTRNYVTV